MFPAHSNARWPSDFPCQWLSRCVAIHLRKVIIAIATRMAYLRVAFDHAE